MTLSMKLLELQRSVRALSKDAKNPAFKYEYVSGSKLLSVLRPKMDELGLILVQSFVPESVKITNSQIYLHLTFTWHDCETGETRTDLFPSSGQNTSLDKAIGCAMTYGERYYLLKQFHIATDEDDVDGFGTPAPAPQPQASEKPKKRPTEKRLLDCAAYLVENRKSVAEGVKLLQDTYEMTLDDIALLEQKVNEIYNING